MTRLLKNKVLINTRLAASYGGWMYCQHCGENIGYLCYSTYDRLVLKYQCHCGNQGSVLLDFEDSQEGKTCSEDLVVIKNRLCCPNDHEPLMTILDKKLVHYDMSITCKSCGNIYQKIKQSNE